jgi:GNAT superfamily N-acetyltransferase
LDLALLRVAPLASKTTLDRFDCGDHDINGFAKKAHKFDERNRARVFCGHLGEAAWGLGFYSLSVMVEDKRKLGTRQAEVYDFGAPLIYVDALGVRLRYQGGGLGRMLLIDALKRAHSVSKNVAVYGVALRSLNDRTTAFYEKHGFGVIEDGKTPLMVVPIWTLEDLFEAPP